MANTTERLSKTEAPIEGLVCRALGVGMAVAKVAVGANQRFTDMGHRFVGNKTYSELEESERTDYLTRTLTRVGMFRAVGKFTRITGVQDYRGVFIDLRNLKTVNDDHSQAMGDHQLKVAGWGVKQLLRLPDELGADISAPALVARWGGDEFLGLMPGETTIDEVFQRNPLIRATTSNSQDKGEADLAEWDLAKFVELSQQFHVPSVIKNSVECLVGAGIDKIQYRYNIGHIALPIDQEPECILDEFMDFHGSKYVRRSKKTRLVT